MPHVGVAQGQTQDFPLWEGATTSDRAFLPKMCVKTKELGPMGDPPRSANVALNNNIHFNMSFVNLRKPCHMRDY